MVTKQEILDRKRQEENLGPLGWQIEETRDGTRGDPYLFKVSGDCMAPTLNSGDIVVIDPRKKGFCDDIYLIEFPWMSTKIPGGAAVQRLQVHLDWQMIRLICDNPLYQNELVDRSSLKVLGKCVGVMKRV